MSFTERINPDSVEPVTAFGTALQSFKTGKIAYGDFLFLIDQQLAAGTSQTQMLSILQHSEGADPLPSDVLAAVLDRISTWPLPVQGGVTPLGDAPTVILENSADQTAPRAVVAVGDVLQARFQLVELIGRGGMSRVFKAIDSRRLEAGLPDPHVAVKVLTLPFHEYFGSIAALQAEAQKLQSLAHPNIVRVFDCDRDGEIVFMTMEYLLGASLQSPGMSEPMERARALGIIRSISEALDYAHRNYIVHGDLKPRNVILTERNEIKVIDFGIARWIPSPDSSPDGRVSPPRKAVFAATTSYASPQVLARQVPEPADDVYALACVAFQLLTGSHPFGNGGGARASRVPPPHLPQLTATEYAALIKALAYERSERTATVREFIDQFSAPPAAKPARAPGGWAIGIAAVLLLLAAGWFAVHREHTNTGLDAPLTASPGAALAPPVAAPGTVLRDCPTCPFATVLPSGKFMQGAPAGEGSSFEQPQHSVSIAYPLAMSSHEVTVRDFQEFIADTSREMQGCDTYDGEWRHRGDASWKEPGFAQGATHPVTCVSWNDAVAYAGWLSAKSGHTYRLPSASEWEYAARAGGASAPWGGADGDACGDANVADRTAAARFPGFKAFACSDGYVNTAPVGSFKANAFGINDMLGNVAEWTQDCWTADYAGAPADGSARQSGDCAEHELRGGSWFSAPSNVTASYRSHFGADYRTSSVGFRLVREINP